jgi:hypothetical protein
MSGHTLTKPLAAPEWTTVKTSADRTTSNLTATDVPDLAIDLLANTKYEFEASLQVNSSSAAGNKYAMNFSAAGGAIYASYVGHLLATTLATSATNALASLSAATFITYAGDGEVIIKGHVTVGANAGQIRVQQAKVTSGNAIVRAGSVLKVRKV